MLGPIFMGVSHTWRLPFMYWNQQTADYYAGHCTYLFSPAKISPRTSTLFVFLGHNSRSNFVGVAQVWNWRFAPVHRILKWRNVVLLSRFGNYITYVSRTRSQTSSKRRFSAIKRRKAKGRTGIVKSAHARSWEAKTEIPPVKIKSTFPIWRYLHALQCQVHKWKEYDLS